VRKMSLIEFGWKLFATALYCWMVSFFAAGQMSLLGAHYLILKRAFAIVFIVSTVAIPVGFVLAVTGHIRKRFRGAGPNSN
jgi:hypothetical protein